MSLDIYYWKNCTVWLKTNLKILMLDTWCNEVFLGDQLCQHGLSFQCFGGFLSLSSRIDALRDAALHCLCAYCWLLWTNVLVQEWTSIKTVSQVRPVLVLRRVAVWLLTSVMPSVNCNGCLLTALLQFRTIFLVPWISN
jgi:hypothetical protein